jgi:hypothetical protein
VLKPLMVTGPIVPETRVAWGHVAADRERRACGGELKATSGQSSRVRFLLRSRDRTVVGHCRGAFDLLDCSRSFVEKTEGVGEPRLPQCGRGFFSI